MRQLKVLIDAKQPNLTYRMQWKSRVRLACQSSLAGEYQLLEAVVEKSIVLGKTNEVRHIW